MSWAFLSDQDPSHSTPVSCGVSERSGRRGPGVQRTRPRTGRGTHERALGVPARGRACSTSSRGSTAGRARSSRRTCHSRARPRLEREAVDFWIAEPGCGRLLASVTRAALRPARSIEGRRLKLRPSPTRSPRSSPGGASGATFRSGHVEPDDPGGRGPLQGRWHHLLLASHDAILAKSK